VAGVLSEQMLDMALGKAVDRHDNEFHIWRSACMALRFYLYRPNNMQRYKKWWIPLLLQPTAPPKIPMCGAPRGTHPWLLSISASDFRHEFPRAESETPLFVEQIFSHWGPCKQDWIYSIVVKILVNPSRNYYRH